MDHDSAWQEAQREKAAFVERLLRIAAVKADRMGRGRDWRVTNPPALRPMDKEFIFDHPIRFPPEEIERWFGLR